VVAKISSNRTIAKNTVLLYSRMLILMLISLFTARINFEVLGIIDKGIFEIVGGTIAMLGFLNGSLAGTTSRFLTYEIGKGDKKKLSDTFAVALTFHIIAAILVFILAETFGLWFIENKAIIPADRMFASKIAYQLCIISSFFSLTQVPYNAALIAHEKMGVFAYMGLLEAALKLLICYVLFIIPFDKLITYSILSLIAGVSMVMIYRIYCIKHFQECRFKIVKDMSIIKPMISFSGWDLFGNFAVMGRTQGVSLMLNTFFGPIVNAAISFANVISGTLTSFSGNFMGAIRPPIIKAYASGDYERMQVLMAAATKYSFAMFLLVSMPFFFEIDFILKLWLGTPPEWTSTLCRWELALNISSILCASLMFCIHATGVVKRISIMNACIILLVLPISYLFLRFNLNPEIPYIVKLLLQGFVFLSCIYNLKVNLPEFKRMQFIKKGIVPCFTTLIIVCIPLVMVTKFINVDDWKRFLIVCAVSTSMCLLATYFFLFDGEMRAKSKNTIHSILKI